MNITKSIFTKNNCYKTGRTQKVSGVMWHSTGADNPFLSRYIPDDGIVGPNLYNNHWNQPKPDGRSVCVHAWIGYIKDKKAVATYQTLPWNHVGWHSGSGPKGSANTKGYIGFEICEDDLRDKKYFDEVYKQGVELTAYLSKMYKFPINATTVIDHSGGRKMGIASNHGDIMHWFRRYGLTMEDVRTDVKKLLAGGTISATPSSPSSSVIVLSTTRNSRHAMVRELQSDLVSLGYDLSVDGSYGPTTSRVVSQFQRDNKLAVDGSAGPATLGKVKELVAKLSKPTSPKISNVTLSAKEVRIKHRGKDVRVIGIHEVKDGGLTQHIALRDLESLGYKVNWTRPFTEIVTSNVFRNFNLNMTYVLGSIEESSVNIKRGSKTIELDSFKLTDAYGNATQFLAIADLTKVGFKVSWDQATKSVIVD